MIEYYTGGKGRRFGLFVHHSDADREFAYGIKDHVGKLSAFFLPRFPTVLILC